MTSWQYLLLYLGLLNLTAFLTYGLDKRKAIRGAFRIPESVLMLLAFFGGAAGALAGMLLFHHKTRKPLFFIGVPLILILHILSAGLILYRSGGVRFL